jgi:hypothetical protein
MSLAVDHKRNEVMAQTMGKHLHKTKPCSHARSLPGRADAAASGGQDSESPSERRPTDLHSLHYQKGQKSPVVSCQEIKPTEQVKTFRKRLQESTWPNEYTAVHPPNAQRSIRQEGQQTLSDLLQRHRTAERSERRPSATCARHDHQNFVRRLPAQATPNALRYDCQENFEDAHPPIPPLHGHRTAEKVDKRPPAPRAKTRRPSTDAHSC